MAELSAILPSCNPMIARVQVPPPKPTLVFDGECAFCRYWLARWRDRVGDVVEFTPFQDPSIADRFPEIPREQFARAVQLIERDGEVFQGAHAVCRTLAYAGRRAPLWMYEHVPGVAAPAEFAYRIVASHRLFSWRLTMLLWGPGGPAESAARPSTYARSAWLFLRLLGVVYLAAFWSLGVQIRGLIGHDGILPAAELLAAVRQFADTRQMGLERLHMLPTLGWLSTSDQFLQALSVGGVVLALLLVAGIAPFVVLPLLWLDYLSLVVVSRDFLSFQWDALLLEAGALAILLAPLTLRERAGGPSTPQPLARWLLWWLLFRLMFGSGIVKLASGDPTWRGLTALIFHYETQPIPTPLAWYMHQLPTWFHKGSTALVLAIELAAPWLIFAPRRPRMLACGLLVTLQVLIALTGNYAFFNLLSIALCLLLLDDAALEIWPGRSGRSGRPGGDYQPGPPDPPGRSRAPRRMPRWVVASVAIVTVPVSVVTLASQAGIRLPGSIVVAPLESLVAPFESVNAYGLFAVMTTTRPEIIVEGSDDGVTWLPYEFRYKAGDPRRRPPWAAPHQPRIDWQMWFAALGQFEQEDWFRSFCRRLLEGSPDVLALVARNPFPAKPPRFVRGVLYQYRFADYATHRKEGVWWVREQLGAYSPVLSLPAR